VNGRKLASKLQDVDRLRNPLEVHTPSIDVRDPFEPAREMYDAVGRDYFTRAGESAKARRDIERRPAKPAFEVDGLARVDADADVQRYGGIGSTFFLEAHLEFDGRPQRLSGRSEDGERFIAADLEDRAAAGLDSLAGDGRESRHQPRGSFVASFLREPRIPADVSDQEGADLGLGTKNAALAFAGAARSVSRLIDG
jgi:hypothetical protein